MYKVLRVKKHKKVRGKIFGTSKRPRLSVFRSNKHIYAQIIDDIDSKTLVSVSDDNFKEDKINKTQKAYEVGKKLAEKAIKKKIESVVFDRGGFLYHGRVSELAKGARDGGLKF